MTTRTSTDPWVRLARITAVIGLSSFVLLFGTIIPLAAVGEPPFTASNDEARAYFANVSVGWPQTATALSSVAGIGILWFMVGLSLMLRRAEGDPPWRSTMALVPLPALAVCAGWIMVATGIFGPWLGWWAIISGLGLALSRFFWTSEIWLLPYLLFWLWVIIVCVQLLRWSPSVSAVPAPASKP
jgi:hypothetical protein